MRVLGVLAQNIRNHPFEVSGSSSGIQIPAPPPSLPTYPALFLSQLGDQSCGSSSESSVSAESRFG
jgi:hypothetical protein